ncbi:TPA: helix-turn-helix domain-containing protein [Clostridium perfringens]
MEERIEEGFVIIPNEMILPNEEGKTMIKNINDKVLPIWIYLKQHECRGKCFFGLDDMVDGCGVKPNSHEGKSNDKFKDILIKMVEENIILNPNIDFSNKKKFMSTTFVKCELMEVKDKFFTVEDYQYRWIMEYKGKEKKINLLKLFCVLKARMYRRSSTESINDGYYETCFPSYRKLSEDTKISESTIKTYLDILVDLNLIRYDNLGTIINPITGETKECNNTYAIYKSGWEDELEGSMRLYKQKLKEQGLIIKKKTEQQKVA